MDYNATATIFKALAHPVRLQILDMLRHGEVCVCHIERALNKRQAYISQQLMYLREQNIVDRRKDGLQVYYRIVAPDIEKLLEVGLGSEKVDFPIYLDDCPCPTCQTELV